MHGETSGVGGSAQRTLLGVSPGLGAVEGFSGDDLTNPAAAVAGGEVPFAGHHGGAVTALELRIHGVGGASAEENLETPSVLQVAGDHRAGFYRPWFPGGSAAGRPRVEAYCWGKLNYQASWSALWLLLLPFGLVNVAHWALPADRHPRLLTASRVVLRLLGLALTTAFVGTTAYLCLDVLAWQAARYNRLWDWLDFFSQRSIGVRLTLAAVPVLLVIAGLWWLSHRTQGDYEKRQSGYGAPDEDGWTLSSSSFWCGDTPLRRQRQAHLTVASAVLIAVLAMPAAPLPWLRCSLLVLAGLLALGAVVCLATPWVDRVTQGGADRGRRDTVSEAVAWGSFGLAAATALGRIWWQPTVLDRGSYAGEPGAEAIPYDARFQDVLLLVPLGLCLVLLILVWGQKPWRDGRQSLDVMAKGFTPVVVALLASLVAGVFGSTVIMSVANVLARPTATEEGSGRGLIVPYAAYAGGLAFAVTLASVLVVGIVLAGKRRRMARHVRECDGLGTLASVYADRGAAHAGPDCRKEVAGTWATSKLTDSGAGGLVGIVLPTAVALVGYEAYLLGGGGVAWLGAVAQYGTTIGVFVTGLFVVYLRSALTSSIKRKRFGFFWDVVTFWPRACHPLGPPSYAERSVPEVVTRIRRVVGDEARDGGDPAVAQEMAESFPPGGIREPHSPVLLVGYSQGSVIAHAAIAQLPEGVRHRVALLTLAAPLRRLYGRAFPAYFGTAQLDVLRSRLSTTGTVRWINLVRRSDYVGGWVLQDPGTSGAVLDREIFDPPVLWADADPAPPPMHLHSDWFADPQTRRFASELAGIISPHPAGP
ncbi:hypothetical protein GCM10010531_00300 [Blastococcus jejuensis]|uniref:Integral membrane protein n=1 Tax=Blastococcus jejuensis TaxID=351224 RepID=A0ABP6NNN5_9ACTN